MYISFVRNFTALIEIHPAFWLSRIISLEMKPGLLWFYSIYSLKYTLTILLLDVNWFSFFISRVANTKNLCTPKILTPITNPRPVTKFQKVQINLSRKIYSPYFHELFCYYCYCVPLLGEGIPSRLPQHMVWWKFFLLMVF